jgi:hypothetical protein
MKEISKGGFDKIERKKKSRESNAIEKNGSIISPISSDDAFPFFGGTMDLG